MRGQLVDLDALDPFTVVWRIFHRGSGKSFHRCTCCPKLATFAPFGRGRLASSRVAGQNACMTCWQTAWTHEASCTLAVPVGRWRNVRQLELEVPA